MGGVAANPAALTSNGGWNKMVKGKSVPAPTQRTAIPTKVQKRASKEDTKAFLASLEEPNKELAFMYFQGVPRREYGKLRAILTELQIPAKWIRNLQFVGPNTLEILAFAEKRLEIEEKLTKESSTIRRDATFDVMAGDRDEMMKLARRIEKSIERIPEPMHKTRKVLQKQLQEVKKRVQEIAQGSCTEMQVSTDEPTSTMEVGVGEETTHIPNQ